MVEFLKKYKTQIINVITIFLILEFAIYPGLTTANTISNILAGIGLLLLIVWGGVALYQFVKSSTELSDEEHKAFQTELENDIREIEADKLTKQKLESELGPVIDKMAKEVLAKPKTKRKSKPIVKIDVTNAKGMNEVAGIVNPIAEGRVKISVENPKPKTEKVLGEFQINNKEKVRKATTRKTK